MLFHWMARLLPEDPSALLLWSLWEEAALQASLIIITVIMFLFTSPSFIFIHFIK